MKLNTKQIVAAISAVALVIILVYPILATGTVAVQIRSSAIEKAEHVYVTIGEVWVHHTAKSVSEGWKLVSNKSQTVDLVALATSSELFGKGQVELGDYDSIRFQISNATWVFNSTATELELESSLIQSNVDFVVQAGRDSVIVIVLTGHQEEKGGTVFFVPTLTASQG